MKSIRIIFLFSFLAATAFFMSNAASVHYIGIEEGCSVEHQPDPDAGKQLQYRLVKTENEGAISDLKCPDGGSLIDEAFTTEYSESFAKLGLPAYKSFFIGIRASEDGSIELPDNPLLPAPTGPINHGCLFFTVGDDEDVETMLQSGDCSFPQQGLCQIDTLADKN